MGSGHDHGPRTSNTRALGLALGLTGTFQPERSRRAHSPLPAVWRDADVLHMSFARRQTVDGSDRRGTYLVWSRACSRRRQIRAIRVADGSRGIARPRARESQYPGTDGCETANYPRTASRSWRCHRRTAQPQHRSKFEQPDQRLRRGTLLPDLSMDTREQFRGRI